MVRFWLVFGYVFTLNKDKGRELRVEFIAQGRNLIYMYVNH